jgi:serine protease
VRTPLSILAAAAVLLPRPAAAVPLTLDPARPPAVVEAAPDLAEAPMGAATLRFPGGTQVTALPAVVLTLDPEVALPWEGPATALGPSGRSWRIPTATVAEAVRLASELLDEPGVRTALPDLWMPRSRARFDDPRYPSQWTLELLEMEGLWTVSTGDPEVRIAVIDSAIDLDHPDLDGAWVEPWDSWDDDDDPRPEPGVYCPEGQTGICDDHGTAVAGIIGARADNGVGIVGMCPDCTLVPIRMLGEGEGTLGRDVAAFEHAIAADAAVINNSWGYTRPTPVPAPLADLVARAATEPRDGLGALVIFAAGNDDREIGDDELQALDQVLCVGATDRYGLPTAYTNRGRTMDVAAPSATVSLDGKGGITTTFGGTSAAAPVVAGLAGWALSVEPDLSAAELQDLLVDTAIPSPQVTHDETGHHPVYGYGEISAAGLLEALRPTQPEPFDEAPPGGCACSAGAAGPPGWSLPLLLLPLLRRRR